MNRTIVSTVAAFIALGLAANVCTAQGRFKKSAERVGFTVSSKTAADQRNVISGNADGTTAGSKIKTNPIDNREAAVEGAAAESKVKTKPGGARAGFTMNSGSKKVEKCGTYKQGNTAEKQGAVAAGRKAGLTARKDGQKTAGGEKH